MFVCYDILFEPPKVGQTTLYEFYLIWKFIVIFIKLKSNHVNNSSKSYLNMNTLLTSFTNNRFIFTSTRL